jgi:hypothetical protein
MSKVEKGKEVLVELAERAATMACAREIGASISVRVGPSLIVTTPQGFTIGDQLKREEIAIVNIDFDDGYPDTRVDKSISVQEALFRVADHAFVSVFVARDHAVDRAKLAVFGHVPEIVVDGRTRSDLVEIQPAVRSVEALRTRVAELSDHPLATVHADGWYCWAKDPDGMIDALRAII